MGSIIEQNHPVTREGLFPHSDPPRDEVILQLEGHPDLGLVSDAPYDAISRPLLPCSVSGPILTQTELDDPIIETIIDSPLLFTSCESSISLMSSPTESSTIMSPRSDASFSSPRDSGPISVPSVTLPTPILFSADASPCVSDCDDVEGVVAQEIIDPMATCSVLENQNQSSRPSPSVPDATPSSTFKFNLNASEYVPSFSPIMKAMGKPFGDFVQTPPSKSPSRRPGAVSFPPEDSPQSTPQKRKTRRGRPSPRFAPIPVPPHDPIALMEGMLAFMDDGKRRVGDFTSPVPPALMRSRVYTVRRMVNVLVETYNPDLTQPITPAMTRPPGEKKEKKKKERRGAKKGSRRQGRGTTRTDGDEDVNEDSDPFHMETLKKTMGISTISPSEGANKRKGGLFDVPGGANREKFDGIQPSVAKGESPWSRELREQCNGEDATELMYTRKIKSLFNKLSGSNLRRIVFERLMPLLDEYFTEEGVTEEDVFGHLARCTIEAVANGNSKPDLFSQTTLALILFCSRRENSEDSDSLSTSPSNCLFRQLVIKELHDTLRSISKSLNGDSVLLDSLEKTNFKKDKFRALCEYAWCLTIRGILPNRIMRREISEMCHSLESREIIEFEKLVILMLAQNEVQNKLGGEGYKKCQMAWTRGVSYLRDCIAQWSGDWDPHSRAESTRLGVLLEIAEAESALHGVPSTAESYPLRKDEIKCFEKYFEESL